MYDPDHHRTIAQLIDRVGNKGECLRLGFLVKDDNETLRLSPTGMGYLIDIVAGDVNALPDAYAAGYKQALAQTETEV